MKMKGMTLGSLSASFGFFQVLIGLIFFYLLVLQITAIWAFTIDDMYITLRYAKNWAEGNGLLWNIGEPRVEGYSNFSFVVVARVALALGFNPVVVLKSMGVLGLIGTCMAIHAITRMWLSRGMALIPCFWLLAYKGQILWAVSGLEAAVYEAFICFSVYFIFRGLGYQAYARPRGAFCPAFFIVAGFLLAMASMTRPEAPALMLLFVFLLSFNATEGSLHIRQQLWQSLACFFGGFFICFAPYFVWHWFYYGRLFPNPVYCKGLTSFLTYSLDKQYIKLIWPFALFGIPALCFRQSIHDKRHYFLWLPSILYLILLIGADPVVAFDNRLFLTAFVLILPLSTLGMYLLIKKYPLKTTAHLEIAMYLGAILVAFCFIPMLSLHHYRQFTENPLAGARLRQGVVAWLANNVPPGGRVVLADSGLIPYESPHQFIDSYCLNNAKMSKISSSMMYQRLCESVFVEKPDAIILTSLIEKGKTIYTPADACLVEKLAHSSIYHKQLSLHTNNRDSYYQYEIFSKL